LRGRSKTLRAIEHEIDRRSRRQLALTHFTRRRHHRDLERLAEDARHVWRPDLSHRPRLGQAGQHGVAGQRRADPGRPESRPHDGDLEREHQQREGEDRQQDEAGRRGSTNVRHV
jgi:hypothetical protein